MTLIEFLIALPSYAEAKLMAGVDTTQLLRTTVDHFKAAVPSEAFANTENAFRILSRPRTTIFNGWHVSMGMALRDCANTAIAAQVMTEEQAVALLLTDWA